MKRRWTLLWACMVMLCAVLLVGCGGSSDKTAEGEGGKKEEAQATDGAKDEAGTDEPEPEPAPDPSEKFLGSWKMAALEMDGITLVGDYSAFLGDVGKVSLQVNEDGTGSMVYGEETGEFTWELKSDDAITMQVVKTEESGDAAETEDAEETDAAEEAEVEEMVEEDGSIAEESLMGGEEVTITYKDDALVIEMEDQDHKGCMYFTKDGAIEGMSTIDFSAATPVTSLDAVVGTWKFSGMNMFGVSMYGDAESLSAMMGESQDMTFTINEDGTAAFMGEEATVNIGEDGAKLAFEDYEAKLGMADDAILIDVSEDSSGLTMTFRFTK